MAGRNFKNLVFNVRFDSKQRALQEALRVPWPQLEETSAAYAEWHMFVLWVRAISENSGELPDIVRCELRVRCPGFLECGSIEAAENRSIWRSLEEWVTAHLFAKLKRAAGSMR